jgi:hypothetical protein
MSDRTWFAYGDLQAGERFRFLYGVNRQRASAEVYTKNADGWYSDERGRRFKTGAATAVKRDAAQQPAYGPKNAPAAGGEGAAVDDPPDDGPLGVRGGTDYDGRDGTIEETSPDQPAAACAKHVGPIIEPCERCGQPWLAHSWDGPKGGRPRPINRSRFSIAPASGSRSAIASGSSIPTTARERHARKEEP